MRKINNLLIAALAGTALLGCRGEVSNQPPIHLVPNMDFQDKLKAQSESKFKGWADHRSMRLPVKGTIARGSLGKHSKDAEIRKLHTWKTADGKFVTVNPLPATLANIKRGRERFNINCAVCHGRNGRGRGIVGRRLATKPPSFVPKAEDDHPETRYDDRLAKLKADGEPFLPAGEIFDVITIGKVTMQQYGTQVSVRDRWCIAHYIHALQYRAKN